MNLFSQLVKGASRSGAVLGMAVVILGGLAIMAPGLAGISANFFIAVLLMATGIARTVFAFKADKFGTGMLEFAFGIITMLCGGAMMAMPVIGLASLTVIVAAYLLVDGVLTSYQAYKIHPNDGWGWTLTSGISSLILAALIAAGWPGTGVWTIGIMLGVRFMFTGMSMITLSFVGEEISDDIDSIEADTSSNTANQQHASA